MIVFAFTMAMVLCLKRFTFHLVASVFTFARAVLKTVPALYTPCEDVATALMDTKGTSKDSNSAVWCNGGKMMFAAALRSARKGLHVPGF